MSTCSVKWCGKNTRTSSHKKDGITFHRFPRCPERKAQWIDATFRGEEWFPSKNAIICSRHFSEDSFCLMKERRRIMDTAVPTLFLPVLAQAPSTKTNYDEISIVKVESISEPDSSSSSSKWMPISLSPQNVMQPEDESCENQNQTEGSETPTRLILPVTISASDSPTEKRLHRRIIELQNIVQRKNKQLKREHEHVRRLKMKINSLKAELDSKNVMLADNILI